MYTFKQCLPSFILQLNRSLQHHFQTRFGVHPASHPMATGNSFAEIKRLQLEAAAGTSE